jgi:hypothetical protein
MTAAVTVGVAAAVVVVVAGSQKNYFVAPKSWEVEWWVE